MVASTELDKHILKLANSFAAASGAKDYTVPLKIVPSPKGDGTSAVFYWTPRHEIRLLGDRVIIVNPDSETAEIVMRD
jgi:hypothetical protein